MFSVGHAVQAAPGFYQLETSGVFVERGTSRFDLLFGATALPDGLALACEYNTDLFEDDTIRQMVACFETLLKAALLNPDCRLSELPLLAPAEIEQQVVQWNDTAVSFPDRCIHELFELQVDRTPSAIAVQDGDETLTYRQLDERANQIARWLISRGAGIETPVGVCLNRSTRLASTLLGVLKAGCACVLLDPSFPSGRLAQMATDADLLMLLADGRQRKHSPHIPGQYS
jgi:non-ribosomal peptide synthetase component F